MTNLKEVSDIKTELLNFQQTKIVELTAELEAVQTMMSVSNGGSTSQACSVAFFFCFPRYGSVKHVIFTGSSLLRVLLHHVQMPPIWSSPSSFSWQLHLQHSYTHIVIMVTFHLTVPSRCGLFNLLSWLASFSVPLMG